MSKNKLSNILLVISVGIFLFGTGYKFGEYQTNKLQLNVTNINPSQNSTTRNIDFTLFWQTWNTLDQKYIDKKKLDPQKMFYGAIKGMVASLQDPYTFFLSPNENKQSKDDLGGVFEGIGAQLGLKDNRIVVIAPLKNSPAEKAGVRSGDYIIKVDNQSTKDWTLAQTVSKIRGQKGTKVTLTLERNQKEIDLTMARDQIDVSTVDLSYESPKSCKSDCPKVAYLKLSQFGDKTNDEWDKAVEDIKNKWQSKEIKGLVLDVRDDPGGYLDGAVYIASEFLDLGKIVVKQESTVQPNKDYYVLRRGQLLDIPLVVLINKGSASASEIVSGALRDYKRAKLIGEKSFGKGSVQEALDLGNDLQNKAGLHVTIAKWILPKGDWINGKGINPDIDVKMNYDEKNTLTKENDLQLEKAIEEVLK